MVPTFFLDFSFLLRRFFSLEPFVRIYFPVVWCHSSNLLFNQSKDIWLYCTRIPVHRGSRDYHLNPPRLRSLFLQWPGRTMLTKMHKTHTLEFWYVQNISKLPLYYCSLPQIFTLLFQSVFQEFILHQQYELYRCQDRFCILFFNPWLAFC